jgi:hypothetical protein
LSKKTYLERYLSGEYVQVWQELALLDADELYREPLFSDVYGVAQKTMRRVRHNLEALHKRWQFMGMEFEYPDEVLAPPQADFSQVVAKFEQEFGQMPLSIRAFYEIVGSVNFCGKGNEFHTPSTEYYEGSDPLWVLNLSYFMYEAEAFDAENYEPYQMELFGDGVIVNFAPDHLHKDNISGGSGPEFLIKAGADCAVFYSEYNLNKRSYGDSIAFVDYLRLAIKWAGFPGFSLFGSPTGYYRFYKFAPDDMVPQLLKDVAKDLLPF